ncbi:hypothetical protein, conserved [Eimeria praecox]|uniref:Uncharacterized protein n=1 Tax=Eimeria praecox TaxID=51316 RepID=U6H4K1_9EIME|nr:hypothetical protein, conserved [Eimeria praecox]
MHKEIWGSPSVRWCIAMFAAASVIEALLASALEMTDTSSSQRHAASVAMPQDEHERLHPLTPGDLVVGHSLSRFGPWIIRVQQKKWQGPHLRAVTVGLVAVVCLAVAFVVLQCAQKALMSTKLFGSVGKRALSGSELEAQWVEACAEREEEEDDDDDEEEEEEKGEEKAGGARAREEEDTSQETGESEALRVLDELRSIMALGLETVPHLPCDKKAALFVLLLTICTQEVAFYGVYSTPRVEQERVKTIDFLLKLGREALEKLQEDGESFQKVGRGTDMLNLLELFKTPGTGQFGEQLPAEAKISVFRISESKEALEQLQPWVERSVAIPEDVSERAIKVVSYTRHEAKHRLKADANTKSYVEEKQTRLGFFGIFQHRQDEKTPPASLSATKEARRLRKGYKRRAAQLASSIKSALSHPQLEQTVQEQRVQEQPQELQPLQEQHHSTSQPAENTAVAIQPGEQLAVLRSGVGVPPPLPSRPLPAPCQGALPTPTPTFLNLPVPQSSHPPRKDSRQHIPTAPPELPDQLPAHSAPTSQAPPPPFSGGSRQMPASRFVPPTVFWPPKDRNSLEGTYPHSPVRTWDFNPVLGLIAEAFPGEGTHWPNEPERIDQWEARWLQDPSSQSFPPSGENQQTPPVIDASLEVPSGRQGASAAFGGTAQTQEGPAWSLRGEYGGNSRPLHAWELNPVLGLIAEAFPGEGAHSPNEPERIDQREAGWLQDPSSQSFPPSGENQEIPPVIDASREVPSGRQGASAAFGGTPQTQEGPAWSLRGDYGGNSRPLRAWDLNPVLGLIAEAFPGEGAHSPSEPERIDQREAGGLRDPSSQSFPLERTRRYLR